MAETKIYRNVRFANRIDTESNWAMSNPTLEPGELAFVGEEGRYFMILGDTHRRPIKQILNEMGTGAHDSHIFYPGKSTGGGSGGGGGGGSTSIPVASATLLGGVKIPEEHVSGLVVGVDGTLTNALVESYDYTRQCFVVNKLYVKDLEYDNKVTNPSFEGDFITLRAESTTALSVKAGIVIKSLQTNFDGFLGLSANNKIMIAQTDGTYAEMVGVSHTGVDMGFVSYNTQNNYATIVPCHTLTFSDSGVSTTYDPTIGETSINITPPSIYVNSQPMTYDPTSRRYDIELEGGLSTENAEKIARLEQSLDDIDTLKRETITDVQSGNKITVQNNNNRTVTVNHNTTVLQPSNSSSVEYVVDYKQSDDDTEGLQVLVDIEVDEYGHITKKHFQRINWILK